MCVCVYFWTLSSVALICLSVFMLMPHFSGHWSFVITVTSPEVRVPIVFFFSKVVVFVYFRFVWLLSVLCTSV